LPSPSSFFISSFPSSISSLFSSFSISCPSHLHISSHF
jgi:hypothetical protein